MKTHTPNRFYAVAVLMAVVYGITSARADEPAKTLDIYCIDISASVGNATLIVSPGGETMLLDAGPPRSEPRTLDVIKQADVKQVDYLVNTHFCADHFGATAALAQQIPVRHFVDHGRSVEYQRDDEWWKGRRGPWFKVNMGKEKDALYETYLKAAESGRHLQVKAGDTVPIKGLEVRVLCANGKVLAEPLPGAGQPNPAGDGIERRADDDAEDGQSIGVLVQYGKFRFVFLGDLTWNVEHALFYPRNLVGTVDAYIITHHAQSLPRSLGDYYYGLSACPKSEVFGLSPRVAILSLGNLGHRQGTSAAMETVRSCPSVEDVWQTEYIREGGEKDHNSPEDFCANLGGRQERTRFIKISARPDGSFTVSNSRNGFTKEYATRAR
jgi:beta-lactamase superfamily II metal-dependent hydrolase